MARKRSLVKIDPELLRQLEAAVSSSAPVEAVFRLRPRDPAQAAVPPDEAEALVWEVIKRVERRSGVAVGDCHVFRNLGFFVVSAKPAFLRELLAQPEIASAMANRQPGEALIPPKSKRPVS